MYIIVCVKQVKNITITQETKLKNNEMFNNPFDLAAVSWAVRLKKLYGFAVVAISMGAPSTMPLVRQLFSYGVDRAMLLTSDSLSGSDTYATSYAIGKLIKTFLPDYSMIICGDKSLDGETGQVPHSLAMELNISSFPNVSDISYHNGRFDIICDKESLRVQLTSENKLLVTVTQGYGGVVCLPTIKNIVDSKSKEVEIVTSSSLALLMENVGHRGSFTKVVSLHNKKTASQRNVCKIYFKEEQEKLDMLMKSLFGDEI